MRNDGVVRTEYCRGWRQLSGLAVCGGCCVRRCLCCCWHGAVTRMLVIIVSSTGIDCALVSVVVCLPWMLTPVDSDVLRGRPARSRHGHVALCGAILAACDERLSDVILTILERASSWNTTSSALKSSYIHELSPFSQVLSQQAVRPAHVPAPAPPAPPPPFLFLFLFNRLFANDKFAHHANARQAVGSLFSCLTCRLAFPSLSPSQTLQTHTTAKGCSTNTLYSRQLF
jgi:hypothetical protein